MPDMRMNKDAEKWLAWACEDMGQEHKVTLRAAMKWAYADAAKVCEAEVESCGGSVELSSVRGALLVVRDAIEARAK